MSEVARSEALSRAIAPFVEALITPALVVDLDAVADNLAATIARVGGPARWRPHLKTCKQAVIVEAMLAAGMRWFKVATCDELRLVLETAGATAVDVVFAYPAQRSTLAAVLALAARHPGAELALLADSLAHLDALAGWLAAHDPQPPRALRVMLDVDLGMDRTGSPPDSWRGLDSLPAGLRVSGLHGYDGHLRWSERDAAHRGYDALCELAESLARAGVLELAACELVTSGTHSYAHALAHERLGAGPWQHRVSPGTIVLSDRRSHEAAADIGLRQAAFVAARVISVGDGRVTLDAGSKGIAPDVEPPSCGVVGHPELEPMRASEEHLPCRVAPGARGPALGELLWLIPEHVCTTVNLHREAVWLRGGEFVGVGPVGASGHRPRFVP